MFPGQYGFHPDLSGPLNAMLKNTVNRLFFEKNIEYPENKNLKKPKYRVYYFIFYTERWPSGRRRNIGNVV